MEKCFSGETSKDIGGNVESDFDYNLFLHTFATEIRDMHRLAADVDNFLRARCFARCIRKQNKKSNNKKNKKYEKDDFRPRGNVRNDNEC